MSADEEDGGFSGRPTFFGNPRMNIHKNASMTPKGRAHLVQEIERIGLMPAAEAAGIKRANRTQVARPAWCPRCAELSTLSRNINQLTALLRQGDVQPAREYRRMLDTLGDDVRAHLSLAASVLADLWPARPSGRSSEPRRPA